MKQEPTSLDDSSSDEEDDGEEISPSVQLQYEKNFTYNMNKWKVQGAERFDSYQILNKQAPLTKPSRESPLFQVIEACPEEWKHLGMPPLHKCYDSELIELTEDLDMFHQFLRTTIDALHARKILIHGASRACRLWGKRTSGDVIRKNMVGDLLKWVQYDIEKLRRAQFTDRDAYIDDYKRSKAQEYRMEKSIKLHAISQGTTYQSLRGRARASLWTVDRDCSDSDGSNKNRASKRRRLRSDSKRATHHGNVRRSKDEESSEDNGRGQNTGTDEHHMYVKRKVKFEPDQHENNETGGTSGGYKYKNVERIVRPSVKTKEPVQHQNYGDCSTRSTSEDEREVRPKSDEPSRPYGGGKEREIKGRFMPSTEPVQKSRSMPKDKGPQEQTRSYYPSNRQEAGTSSARASSWAHTDCIYLS